MTSLEKGMPVAEGESKGGTSTERSWRTRLIRRLMISFLFAGSRLLNPLIRRVAGTRLVPILAIVSHAGGRSGRVFSHTGTSSPTPDGFDVPRTSPPRPTGIGMRLPLGNASPMEGSRSCRISPGDRDWAPARSAFYPLERALMPAMGFADLSAFATKENTV